MANNGNATASVIDTKTNTLVKTISVGSQPEDVAITPDGGFAYMTNNGDGTVSVIDTTANIVVKTITVGSSPDGLGPLHDRRRPSYHPA